MVKIIIDVYALGQAFDRYTKNLVALNDHYKDRIYIDNKCMPHLVEMSCKELEAALSLSDEPTKIFAINMTDGKYLEQLEDGRLVEGGFILKWDGVNLLADLASDAYGSEWKRDV